MRTFLIALFLLAAPLSSWAAEGSEELKAPLNLSDQNSLQRGAKYFFNYCSSCHSLEYMRYNRVAIDIGIDTDSLKKFILPSYAKEGDLITKSMNDELAAKWFGNAPPDLTLVTRRRSPNWLYSYLQGFYLDPSRPWGVNNEFFPDVGMPDILGQLSGSKEAEIEMHNGAKIIKGFKQVNEGKIPAAEYKQTVADITNFLTYIGEPIQQQRKRLGVFVLVFLGLLFIPAYLMKKEFWKDVH